MSGVTPLVDTLLATRLAQRLDLLPLKGQFDIAGPGVVTQVEQVTNDVRLSSRAALQQQVSVAPPGRFGADHGAPSANLGESVTLSAVARALTAILDPPASVSARILGTAALWPRQETPDTPQLTATLLRTVANSGLFYESHLHQFAAGERTLAQLAQEPQAQLAGSTAAAPVTALAARAELAVTASQADLGVVLATAPEALGKQDVGAPVHPQALALVRQQLELLALPLFRWSGEAWPGTAMDWEIQEEQDQRQAVADDQTPARSWTSKLALSLPSLGTLEARLSLAGHTLQLRLAARQSSTVSVLSAASTELPGRLGALGLQLTGLQIGSLAAEPVHQT